MLAGLLLHLHAWVHAKNRANEHGYDPETYPDITNDREWLSISNVQEPIRSILSTLLNLRQTVKVCHKLLRGVCLIVGFTIWGEICMWEVCFYLSW